MSPPREGDGAEVTPPGEGDGAAYRTVLAPGKVNLCLLVGPRRPDGYHGLFTVFAPLGLADRLDLRLSAVPAAGKPPTVTCPGVGPEDNLVTRALRALERETGWSFSGNVAIDKRLPVAGGVGGGSADAATVLLAANRLLADAGGPALEPHRLRRLAVTLGADVPFFLDPRPSLARGVGEALERLPLPPLPVVLVARPEGLSTAAVYRAFDEERASERADGFSARSGQAEDDWRRLSGAWAVGGMGEEEAVVRAAALLRNDLESSACRLLPGLDETLRRLVDAGALAALVSGSGPTVFGLWRTPAEAAGAARVLQAAGWDARATTAAPARP